MKSILHIQDCPDGIVALAIEHVIYEWDGVSIRDCALIEPPVVDDYPPGPWVLFGDHKGRGCPICH